MVFESGVVPKDSRAAMNVPLYRGKERRLKSLYVGLWIWKRHMIGLIGKLCGKC